MQTAVTLASYEYALSLFFSRPVTEHVFLLRCLPASNLFQRVLRGNCRVATEGGEVALSESADNFGNRLLSGRIAEAHNAFRVEAGGLLRFEGDYRIPEPAPARLFLYPSPYTSCDSEMTAFARDALEGEGGGGNAREKASFLLDALARRFAYAKGVTTTETTAAQAFALSRGVCQDYAHVFIALCRAAGIPARYVTGFIEGEGESHAWAEFHDGKAWLGADPTHGRLITGEPYIKLSHGRDYGDCSIERGVFLGQAAQTMRVEARVRRG